MKFSIVVQMILSTSPWIEQLKNTRQVVTLNNNHSSPVAIIGAGIAGVSTAYFTLTETNFDVVVVEAGKAAHGATGHNAGQIVSYFEKQLSVLVQEYGLEKAAEGQRAIDSAWTLIEQIYADTKIETPLAQFTGYAGCQDREEVLVHLENIVWCKQANIPVEPIILAEDVDSLADIPVRYAGLYTRQPQKEVLSLLETNDTRYIAVLSARKGCMNSALFCEDLLDYLLKTYPDRFVLLEDSPVSNIRLEKNTATLSVRDYQISTDKVILCTNGFENFSIQNAVGADIERNFHQLVKGSVGYMAAYLEDHERPPVAISYLPERTAAGNEAVTTDPYFYLTRRTFEDSNQKQSLICVGGLEAVMDDTNNYQKEHPYPEEAQALIDGFLHKTYKFAPTEKIKYKYTWHGLMGYTPNGIRCIGPEPINPVILYNLGCNGVGILPSIYGGKKISQFLRGEKLAKSIFDPEDHRTDILGTQSRPSNTLTNTIKNILIGV